MPKDKSFSMPKAWANHKAAQARHQHLHFEQAKEGNRARVIFTYASDRRVVAHPDTSTKYSKVNNLLHMSQYREYTSLQSHGRSAPLAEALRLIPCRDALASFPTPADSGDRWGYRRLVFWLAIIIEIRALSRAK
jgi:hypothetical protein